MTFSNVEIAEALAFTQKWITEYAVQPLLILFIGIFIAKITEQALLFIFRQVKLSHPRYRLISWFALIILSVASVCIALASVDLFVPAVWFLGGAVTLVLIMWLGLALFDVIPNAWSHREVRRLVKEGSTISNKFAHGKIIAVRLTDTHLKTTSGDNLFVPNMTMRRVLSSKK